MASDGSPGAISGASAVLNGQASEATKFQPASGKTLPPSGNSAALTTASTSNDAANASRSSKSATPTDSTSATSTVNSSPTNNTAASHSDPQSLVDQINKYLNDSGQADQFRLDPVSANYIQQVNPATGAVIAQYSVSEFPALARSIGISGLLVDEVA
jgi:uncharacterized FlaG/YvyC family protein